MLRLRAEDFMARLPWFYHGLPFDPPAEQDILSFEVNGLEVAPGRYAVTLVLDGPCECLEVSRSGGHFEPIPAHGALVPLPPFDLTHRMLSFLVRSGDPDRPCPMREAEAIRRYVQAGGTVIADVQPGVCDQHGKPVRPGLLDDLFGLERIEGPGLLAQAEGEVTGLGQVIALPGIDVDGNVRAAGAQAMGSAGEVPLVLVKQTGAGRTVLLNYSFGSIARARMEPAALAHREVLYALLATAKVTPQVQVTVGEEPLRGLETVRYADGPVQYLGFLKQRIAPDEPTTAARISTTERLHTWDLRTGEYLGLVDAWDARFVPSRGSLFARLPYRVDGLRLSVSKGAVEANERERLAVIACTVRLLTGDATPGRQWVNVRVLGPDGVERRHYARNVAVEGGSAVSYVPMALSDQPGTWTVIARDVISGERAEASFTLGG